MKTYNLKAIIEEALKGKEALKKKIAEDDRYRYRQKRFTKHSHYG